MTAEAAPQSETYRSAASTGRRFVFALVLLALLAGICAPFFVDPVAHDAPKARGGVVDYSQWGPLSAPVELKGDWRLVWRSAPLAGARVLSPVPGDWAGAHAGGATLPSL